MSWVITLIACILACKFFAILFHAPARIQWLTSALGGIAYVLSLVIGGVTGAFVGALLVSLAGEIAARIKKVTAASIIMVALVPLVPGVGMYETMLLLVQGDPDAALLKGVTTIATAGAIAGAIAFGSSLTRLCTRWFVSDKK